MNEAQRLYAEAVEALNRRQWQTAHAMGVRLVGMVPGHGGVHFVAGVAALQLQQLPEGIRHLQRAVYLSPTRADYAAQFARALAMARLTREALVAADAAAAMAPDDPATLDTLGVVYTQANEHAKAITLFEHAASKLPGHAAYRFNLGTSHTFLGHLDRAEHEYEACLAREPGHGKAHLALAQLRKATVDANHLARLQGLLGDAGDAATRMYLNLALAKEYEDLGAYAQAFAHLTAGKAAGGEDRGYRCERDAALFAAIEQVTRAASVANEGSTSEEPIFVIGLPRSGTTLVDRILSSHPLVHSAGELQNFGVILKRASGSRTPELLDVDTVMRAGSAEWRQLGDAYVASTRPASAGKPRFVDKLPHNFLYAGFIARALPKARIICLRRNPMDSCLGNFRQLFAQSTPYYDYSFALLDTGRYYLLFDQLMRHWQDTMPGRILEIDYESIIEDQEGTTRGLLAHCGLDWNEACMRFNDNAAPVATASAVQVRQPLHRDALQRWKHYEPQLAALRALLEEGGVRV